MRDMKRIILSLLVLWSSSAFLWSQPVISQQPVDQMVTNGGTATFSVSVAGADAFSCQWQFQSTNLPGATNSSLSLTNVQPRQSGAYSVIVSNETGTVTSSNANLTVYGIIGWGQNGSGQLNVPADLTNVIALAAGDYHVLALRSDGSVVAWGGNEFFYGETNVPSNLSNVVSIAAGSSHSLALKRDGSVVMWGRTMSGGISNVPPQATNVAALALGPGAEHALVLKADGTVVEWGKISSLTNIPPAARNIVSVAAGAFHAVALRADGKVIAWGDNNNSATNVPANATNVVAVAAGWYGNAALRADGTSLYWGATLSFTTLTNLTDITCPFSSPFTGCVILGLRRDGSLSSSSTTSPLPQYPTNYISAIAAGSYNAYALIASGPPVFPCLPVNRCVPTGASAYFHANAVGAAPMFYQWTSNGTNIPGATNTTFVLTNVQPGLAGNCYALVASNAFGVATNGPMVLNEVPLETSIQPPILSVSLGSTARFGLYTNGSGPFTFQWQTNGIDIDGATNSSLSLTNVQLSQSGTYSVVVGNTFGFVTNTATLLVQPFIFSTGVSNSCMTSTGMVLRLDSVFAPNSVVIFGSTDLVNWLPIWTNPAATGSVLFVDRSATNSPQGFYRAVEQ